MEAHIEELMEQLRNARREMNSAAKKMAMARERARALERALDAAGYGLARRVAGMLGGMETRCTSSQ